MPKSQGEKVNGENWDGILYEVKDRKDKVMIVMSGSDGGLEHARKLASFLKDEKIPALALGIFKTKHTGKELNKIPIERIKSVINWLKERGYNKIGIEGASKGAEYALAAAIEYPEISCVIVKTPSWYYGEGLKNNQPSGDSSWSINGKAVPFTPYKERKFNILKMLWKAKEYNILSVNLGKDIVLDSIIPVEKIKAPILIMSTKVDTIWPSEESSKKICNRLKENNFSYPYKHISFDYMSHMMLEYCGKEIKYFIKSEKENPKECFKEREIMGKECVKWIEEIWN